MESEVASASGTAQMPTHLGRYEVRAKLADGGMATLYLGRLHGPAGFERPVALKVIKEQYLANKEFVSMFLDEAKIVARVSHPNVVQLYELGTQDDRLFIAMELLVGQSLWNVWQACRERKACLRLDLIAWIGARVGEGLHHAHELTGQDGKSIELVHRDVNASNIFLTYDGHVKLIDFGLVKATNRVSRTAEGIVKGKVAYLSPEQATGKEIDRRTDVFALGTTLWELTTDRRLFKAKTDVDTLRAIKDANVPDPTKLVAGYPPALWKCLQRALAKDPDDRYSTVAEFSRDLDECSRLEGRTITSSTLAEVLRALFGKERERQMAWINEVSTKTKEEPVSVPNPFEIEISFADMAAAVDAPKGTLVPSSERGLPDPEPIEDASAPKLVDTVPPPSKDMKAARDPFPQASKRTESKATSKEKEDRLASTSPGMRSPLYERTPASVPPPRTSKTLLVIVALVSAGLALAIAAIVSSMMK